MIFYVGRNPNLAEKNGYALTNTAWTYSLMAVTDEEYFNEDEVYSCLLYTSTCLAIPKHMEAYPADDTVVFDGADTTVKNTWTGYVSDGDAVLAEPEDYITMR